MKKFFTLHQSMDDPYKKFIATAFYFFILLYANVVAAQAPLVSLQNGHLVYNKYANRGQQNAVNQVPDFSNAGYKGGGVSLPVVAVKETVQPITGDCRALIQAAIDRVSVLPPDANGQRGAVLLKAGVYPVEGSLYIKASGVVLRGEGNGLTGTGLIATQKTQHDFIIIQGSGSGYSEVSGSRVKITTTYVPTGTKTFEVAANHSFVAGDNIVIQRTPNQAWIDALDMAQYGWTPSAYRNTFERKVVSVQGTILTIDIPIVDPVDQLYGGGDVFKSNITGRISECGVENMRLESYFATNDDESHGWNAVVLKRAQNSWVKNVIAKFFGYAAVSVSTMSRFNTVEDCGMVDPKSVTTGGRKYSFNLESDATSNLFQRCMTWGGRHDYVSGSRVPGPNVFLDCIAENTFADIGPHHRWATGELFDNIYGGQIRVQNRGASGSGHGWAGAQILFWNLDSYKSDIEVESPPAARNWGIGCIGVKQTNTGYWESWGAHVLPRSIYLQQLEDRLGAQAVLNITTPEQIQNTLRAILKARVAQIAAEPKLTYGTGGGGGSSASFDITDNGGTITAQYSNTSKPSENYPSVIDNNTSTKYYQSGRRALWIQYQSKVPAIVVRYTITSANDVPNRDPRDWNLQGSNNGSSWTTLDTRTGQTFASRFLTKSYSFTNTASYIYYRLNITNNNGETGTQLAEWELYERRLQTISFAEIPDQTYGDDPFELIASSSSGLPVTFEIVSGPASLEDGFLTITGAGTIIVRASQAGDEKYFPASIEQTFIVNKAAQTISFGTLSPTSENETIQLSATSSAGLPVGFSVVSGPGTITGNNLSFTGAGQVTVRASQPGNENYLAADPVDQTILVYGTDEKKDGIKIFVYPNPTHGQVRVKLDNKKDKKYTITIYNDRGIPVATTIVEKSFKVFEVDFNINQTNGLYYLHVTDGTEVFVVRIFKY
ncbi:MAG TPA: T9SS type A sorting domain-containing protein [Chitinophagaceae bacterium]